MTDTIPPLRRSENMRRIRDKHTSPEMTVRRIVHAMGFRYRLHSPQLPGKPDLSFRRLQKIIEVRGCFWHQHGKCADSHIPGSRVDYWRPKLQRNQQRDRENLKRLRKLGWHVLVIWECEVRDTNRTAARIQEFLKAK